MSGAILLLPLYAFMAWTVAAYIYLHIVMSSQYFIAIYRLTLRVGDYNVFRIIITIIKARI